MDTPRVSEWTAPSAWASYLFTGETSGLLAWDTAEADAFLAAVGRGAPVGYEDYGFCAYSGARVLGIIDYAAYCQTYTFLSTVGGTDP